MSVAEAAQSFAGIANENEFYGHHFLAEVFKGDIRALIDAWPAAEDAAEGQDLKAAGGVPSSRTPHKRLARLP